MKKSLVLLLLASAPAFAYRGGGGRGGNVHVRSTVTKTGEYRQAHVRTAPDRTQTNNWSSKPNVNPYTGKAGTKTPVR